MRESESSVGPYAPATLDHIQHPRNVGRIADAGAVGRVDDAETETTIMIYLRVQHGRVMEARHRTFGCSACVAAASLATERAIGQTVEALLEADALALDAALGGLPPAKRFCAELAVEALARAARAWQAGPG